MSELVDREAVREFIKSYRHSTDVAFDMEKRLDEIPAASPWHRVEEPPKDGQECIVAYSGPTDWIYEHATYHSDLNKALEEDIFIDGTDGFIVDGDVGYARHSFNYWMPIEPPKEVQIIKSVTMREGDTDTDGFFRKAVEAVTEVQE